MYVVFPRTFVPPITVPRDPHSVERTESAGVNVQPLAVNGVVKKFCSIIVRAEKKIYMK